MYDPEPVRTFARYCIITMHVPIKMRSCVHERFALVQQKESRTLEAFAFLVDKRTAFASSKKKVVIVSGCVIDFISADCL